MLHYWAGAHSAASVDRELPIRYPLGGLPVFAGPCPEPGSPGLRDPVSRAAKRVLDVAVAIFLLILALPLGALIALAIVLEKRGPVFFGHTRIGKGRRRFRVWKFRSMVVNADAMLAPYLGADPDHRREWRETHKLKDDPRVTRVGRLLRRTRLDELPQLINVLRGEMSMVGPRPIVEEEIPKYGAAFISTCRCCLA